MVKADVVLAEYPRGSVQYVQAVLCVSSLGP